MAVFIALIQVGKYPKQVFYIKLKRVKNPNTTRDLLNNKPDEERYWPGECLISPWSCLFDNNLYYLLILTDRDLFWSNIEQDWYYTVFFAVVLHLDFSLIPTVFGGKLAFYLQGWSSRWPGRGWNSGPPNCKSSAPTARTRSSNVFSLHSYLCLLHWDDYSCSMEDPGQTQWKIQQWTNFCQSSCQQTVD